MRWTRWLIVFGSFLALSCATAPAPVLNATLVVGDPGVKRAAELKGRELTVTVTQVDRDGRPSVRTASATLGKEEYQRLLARFDALDLRSFKDLYTGRDIERAARTTMVRVSYRGVERTVTILGPPPDEVRPLLDPLLPLLDRLP